MGQNGSWDCFQKIRRRRNIRRTRRSRLEEEEEEKKGDEETEEEESCMRCHNGGVVLMSHELGGKVDLALAIRAEDSEVLAMVFF